MRVNFRNEASRLLLAAVLLAASPAAAQDYPSGVEDGPLRAWLEKSTNIEPASVVAITSELVVAIVGKTMPTTPGGPVRLTLREEVIAPAYVDKVGGRSSLMSMEIHCEERRLRMDERRLYAGLSLSGEMEITEPSAEWFRIPEGSIMDEVARAACDADYAWPLRAGRPSPAASGFQVAAVETPVLLPPGPDAKPVPDEPAPPVEIVAVVAAAPPDPEVAPSPEVEIPTASAEQILPVEAAPAPETEVSPESAPEPAPPTEATNQVATPAEPISTTEVAVSPEPTPAEIPSDPPQILSSSTAQQIVVVPDTAATAPDVATPLISEGETPRPAADIPPPPAMEPPLADPTPETAPDPAPAAPGFLVQIGAYETSEMAEEAWAALSANRPVLVDGLTFDIQEARVKGKNWRRGLVGPFATRQDAGAFCSALAGSEYGCILRQLTD